MTSVKRKESTLLTPTHLSDGFRIEPTPNSKITNLLMRVSVHLRNESSSRSGSTTRKFTQWVNHHLGEVTGTWIVRKSGAVSFRGYATEGYDIEYLYGKLTIGRYLNSFDAQQCISKRLAFEWFSKLIRNTFPELPLNSVSEI